MMLAPGCRKTISVIDGLPFAIPNARISSTESVTVAISCNRTGAPLRYITTSGAYSLAVNNWSVDVNDQVVLSSLMLPLGRFAFAAPSAVRTSSSPIPRWFRIVGLMSTRTAGADPPPTMTCPTPCT